MRVFVKILGISLGFLLIYKWRYRFMSFGLYIPFIRRFVVAREFEKLEAMTD